MKVLRRTTLVGAKLAILAAAVLTTSLAFGSNANAGSGGQPTIFFSTSATAPIPASAIIVNPNTLREIYVWVKDVDNSTGVSGFTLAVQFNNDYFTLGAQAGDLDGIGDKTWLGSTGRTASCIPEQTTPQPGRVVGLCSTLGTTPPYGPTGYGLLGHLRLNTGSELHPASPLTLIPSAPNTIGTRIVDTTLDPQEIPATLQNSAVVFLDCADNSGPDGPGYGDGVVDLSNDILGVILRYQWTSSTSGWHPAYDVNHDGIIDLSSDILGTVLEYQMHCVNQYAK